MALSFLYLAFIRMLQLLRLFGRDNEELAIEVVMLCDEVAVLRPQVDCPALRPLPRDTVALGRIDLTAEPDYAPWFRSVRGASPVASRVMVRQGSAAERSERTILPRSSTAAHSWSTLASRAVRRLAVALAALESCFTAPFDAASASAASRRHW